MKIVGSQRNGTERLDLLLVQLRYFTDALEDALRNRVPKFVENILGDSLHCGIHDGFSCGKSIDSIFAHLFKRVTRTTSNMDSEALTTPQENELSMLTHSIIEWRRLKELNDARKQETREANTKMKALEDIIVRVMKSHNIGALDLKNSGGRVLFKKSKRTAGLGQKNMEKLIAEHLESQEKAQS